MGSGDYKKLSKYKSEMRAESTYQIDGGSPSRTIPVRAVIEREPSGSGTEYRLRMYGTIDGREEELFVDHGGQYDGDAGRFPRQWEAKACAQDNIRDGFIGHE